MDHFYATDADGTIIVSDNNPSRPGKSLFVEVSDQKAHPVSTALGGMLTFANEGTACTSLTREQAIELRNHLDAWLGE